VRIARPHTAHIAEGPRNAALFNVAPYTFVIATDVFVGALYTSRRQSVTRVATLLTR